MARLFYKECLLNPQFAGGAMRNPVSTVSSGKSVDLRKGKVVFALGLLGFFTPLLWFCLLFAFGLLDFYTSLLALGLLFAIPGWVMGFQALKEIKASIISHSEKPSIMRGIILGILGTILFLFALLILESIFSHEVAPIRALFRSIAIVGTMLGIILALLPRIKEHQRTNKAGKTFLIVGGIVVLIVTGWLVSLTLTDALKQAHESQVWSNKDAIVNDLYNLAADAYQYKNRPSPEEGGDGSYKGYELPQGRRENENGSYKVISFPDSIVIEGKSVMEYGSVTVTVGIDGKCYYWRYTAMFNK